MSKIRIKGDTSGHVDLETSATGSNLSIGGNTTVTGTAAITGPATISGPNNYEGLIVENTATDFAGGYMKIRDGNSTAGQYTWIGRNSDITYVQSSNSNVAMQFTNAGIVTKENQPSFWAYMPTGNPTITVNPTKIPYTLTRFNVGNHFNTTNNRFIAPVEGKYLFQVNHNVYGLSDDQYFRTRIYVNGSPYGILGYAKARGGGDHTTNDSMLISLSPSDYVEVFTSSNDTSYQMSAGDGWNHFSGFLVG